MAAFEITAPDGARYQITAPDDATDAEVQNYVQTMTQAPIPEGFDGTPPKAPYEVLAENKSVKGNNSGAGNAFAYGFNQVVPYGKDITARIGAGVAKIAGVDDSYSELYNLGLADINETLKSNPKSALAGNAAGIGNSLLLGAGRAITGAIPASGLRGAVNAIPDALAKVGGFIRGGTAAKDAGALARLGRFGLQSGKSAALAVPSGALYGAGEAGPGNRTEGAKSGAGLAALTGAAVPGVGLVASKALESFAPLASKVVGRKASTARSDLEKLSSISEGNPIAPSQYEKVYNRLRADYPDEAAFKTALQRYGNNKDLSLLEAGGQRTQNLAEGASVYPSGGARATEFFDEEIGQAPERLKSAVQTAVSPSRDFYTELDSLVDEGRKKAGPIYDRAFKENQAVQSPIIDRILDTPEGKSALAEAGKNLGNELITMKKPDPKLTELAKQLSSLSGADVKVENPLSLHALDYVKKAMDSTINKAIRAGDDGEARRIINLKNGLVSELDKADTSGLYSQARKASGDYLSNKKAMEEGLNFLNADKDIIERSFSKYGESEQRAYKNGAVKSIRDKINNTQDGSNVARLFSKPSTRDKLKTLLPEDDYNKLKIEADAVDNIYKLRNKITGNSRTAIRQIAAQEFDNEGAQVIDDLISKGATRTAIDNFAGFVARRFDGLSDRSAKQVADILFEKDPVKKAKIVNDLYDLAQKDQKAMRQLEVFYGLGEAINARTVAPRTAVGTEEYP